nr:LuxR C-terminal-related transcriptional regulator [Bacteriovorax sp. HI3]
MDNIQTLLGELKRLSKECRLHSKGARPELTLMRVANSLESLVVSLNDSPSADSPLTAREKEVLFHVSQGYTNREIASAFNLSEKTIEFHLKSIFAKTEASTRTEAVKNAINNRWLTPS